MKVSSLSELERALASSTSAVAVVSKEPIEREVATETVLGSMLEGEPRELALRTFQGEGVDERQLLGELQEPPFLVRRAAVLVQRAHKMKKHVSDALVSYLANPSPKCCLILVAESFPVNTRLAKAVDAVGILLSFAALKPWEKEEQAARQLVVHASKSGKGLSEALAKRVLRGVGGDALAAVQEIDKLVSFVGQEKEITSSTVAAIATSLETETIWALVEALLLRKGGRAVETMRGLLYSGESFIAILVSLRGHMRDAHLAATLLARGAGMQAVAEALPNRYRVEQFCQRVQQYGVERCRRSVLLLHQADLHARSSIARPELLADRLIGQLVQ